MWPPPVYNVYTSQPLPHPPAPPVRSLSEATKRMAARRILSRVSEAYGRMLLLDGLFQVGFLASINGFSHLSMHAAAARTAPGGPLLP